MTLKNAISARKPPPNTIPELKEVSVQEEDGKIPLKDVQNLVKSMPKRAELVHKAKGLGTKY